MNILLFLLTIHFVADFILQTDWMAVNKSKDWSALFTHVWTYSLMFLLAITTVKGLWIGLMFFGLTFLTHAITDAITSRITSYLWGKGDRHNFFVVIGFDQLIHAWTLALTWSYLT